VKKCARKGVSILTDGIERLIAILDAKARDLEQLANDARDLFETQLSKDTEDFLLHRAEIINSEIALVRKQLQQLIQSLENSRTHLSVQSTANDD
jgi:hypothetical protein